jgi:acyl transferase domain-containing protein
LAHARLWDSCGVRPAALLGEDGPGRWAAAHLARACTFDEAMRALVDGRERPADHVDLPTRSRIRVTACPAPASVGEQGSFARQLGEAFVSGVRLDWTGVFAGLEVRRVPLPTYAFRKAHHWYSPSVPRTEVS